MLLVKEISDEDGVIAQVLDTRSVKSTDFCTPDFFNLQVGFGVDHGGREYIPHIHTEIQRSLTGTSEFIFVLEGQMEVAFLDVKGALVGTASIAQQMAFVQMRGGHAIKTHPGTRFFEVKQGPYPGRDVEKRQVPFQWENRDT